MVDTRLDKRVPAELVDRARQVAARYDWDEPIEELADQLEACPDIVEDPTLAALNECRELGLEVLIDANGNGTVTQAPQVKDVAKMCTDALVTFLVDRDALAASSPGMVTEMRKIVARYLGPECPPPPKGDEQVKSDFTRMPEWSIGRLEAASPVAVSRGNATRFPGSNSGAGANFSPPPEGDE